MILSKKLKDSVDKSKEVFEDLVQDISQVSHDIRFLELFLKNYALNSPFQSLFSHEFKILSKTDQDAKRPVDFEHHSYEFVSWEMNKKEKKSSFRIFYKKYEALLFPNREQTPQESPVEPSCTIPKDSNLLENRPLVETSVLTRLKIYPHLPTFLEELVEELLKHKTKLDFSKFKHSMNDFEKTIKKRRKSE